jgi:hypothetical protein
MPQDTLLGMLQRPPSLPPLSEEEQAYANARAEREQAALRARRTAARPGISDAAWRTAYNVGDVVDRAAGTLGGFVKGAIAGSNESLADPWSDIDPNMRFSDLSSEQVGDLFGLAIMPLLSPLRNPVYQAQMLRKLRKQISRLDQKTRPALERLMETHPRLLAAFQHAGGTLEGNVNTRLGPSGMAEGLYRNLLTRQATGVTAHAPLSPDFTSFKGTPGIQFKGGPYLTHDPATVVPHEFAHFAQDLGGHGVLRQKIDFDAHMLADKAEGLSDRWKQFRAGGGKIGLRPGELDQGTFPMSPEQYRRHNEFMDEGRRIRSLPGEDELGAERAAIRQRERFERWKRGESDWDQYKGPGHGQEARHLTLDEAEPGKLTRKLVVAGRWTEEKRKLMAARSDRQRRRWDQERRKALAESAQKRREGLRRFWPF